MGWEMPWYSAQPSLGQLLGDRELGLFHLICYVRDGDRVFETYWTQWTRLAAGHPDDISPGR